VTFAERLYDLFRGGAVIHFGWEFRRPDGLQPHQTDVMNVRRDCRDGPALAFRRFGCPRLAGDVFEQVAVDSVVGGKGGKQGGFQVKGGFGFGHAR